MIEALVRGLVGWTGGATSGPIVWPHGLGVRRLSPVRAVRRLARVVPIRTPSGPPLVDPQETPAA